MNEINMKISAINKSIYKNQALTRPMGASLSKHVDIE